MASHAVDSKTRQRLATRRLIVVDTEAARAQAFVQALRASGATAIAVCSADTKLEEAHKLDAEIMLTNADEPACQPAIVALLRHPRTRWATVLPLSFAELWLADASGPDLSRIADRVSELVAPAVELAVRAKGKLPYTTGLEPLGPNRLLRALANTGRELRITLTDELLCAEIDLAEGRVRGVRARVADDARELTNAEALSAVLAATSAHVLIEERPPDLRSRWNVSLNGALSAAAALGHPVPEAPEQLVSSVAIDPPSRVQPASAIKAPVAPESVMFGSDPLPTVPGTPRAELEAQHAAPEPDTNENANETTVAVDSLEPSMLVVIENTPEAALAVAELETPRDERPLPATVAGSAPDRIPRKPSRARGLVAAGVALAGVLALLGYLQLSGASVWRRALAAVAPASAAPRTPAATARATAAVHPSAPPAIAAAAPAGTPEAAPAAAARAEPPFAAAAIASEALPRKPPTRDELRRAKSLTDQARRHRRARRLEAAAATYLKALELVSDHQEATLGMVRLHLGSGNSAEAVRWAKRLVELQPNGHSSHLLLGEAYARSGEQALAEQAWRRASELGSDAARKRLRRKAQR